MTTKHKQPKTPHSATVPDSVPYETGTTDHQSAVFDQILFRTPDKDLNSTFAQASIDTNTKAMKLSLANCKLAVFGQCSTAPHSDCHFLRKRQEQADLGRAHCHPEQIRPTEAEADRTVHCFGKPAVSNEESQQKPNNLPAEILLDVEPSLPLIRKQGFLNGPQCEEILKNLELLQDNGKFEEHQRLFNFFLQRHLEKGNDDMEVNKQQIPNGGHSNQVLKKFQLFQEKRRLKEDELLFSLYSRLCT